MAFLSLGSVMKISIRMPIFCDIWVFVSMTVSCLVNLSMKHVFCLIGWFVLEASSCFFAFGLSVDQVVGYSDWSHTFWSCNLGRNGSDCLCDGIFVTFI